MTDDSAVSCRPRPLRPIGLSLLLHALLATLLLLWSFFEPAGQHVSEIRRASIVLAVQKNDQTKKYLNASDSLAWGEEDSQLTPSGFESEPPAIGGLEPLRQNARGSFTAGARIADASRMSTPSTGQRMSTEMKLTKENLELIESDQRLIRSQAPVGRPASLSVFGSKELIGRDFVFVIDRSKSMGEQGLGVIEKSRIELGKAIQNLEEHHRFQIVGYHDSIVTMSTRRYLQASKHNKREVANFIGNLAAIGGTEHESGLLGGLAFRPDVIVWITDGGYPLLNAAQLRRIRKMAGDKTQIHCIQFGIGPLHPKTNFMVELSHQNNGSFRYIDINHWKPTP